MVGSSPISRNLLAICSTHAKYELPGGFSVGMATSALVKPTISSRYDATASRIRFCIESGFVVMVFAEAGGVR